jgi:hypothetical protein
MNDLSPKNPEFPPNFLIYQSEDGQSRVQVRLEDGNAWLTQLQLAVLFKTTVPNINIHIRNILDDGELTAEATIKDYLTVRLEGNREVRRRLEYYNLDMILAVGYRVRSPRGVQFRQWASEKLKDFITKGFVLDDERLKGDDGFARHFEELLARIRDIRASEKRVYQRVREIFALSVDYVEGRKETQLFFATMQNKMHFAATGMTAAEIVRSRADAASPQMGLTSWSGDRILKKDVNVAKNYLTEPEIDTLNRIVVMFLDQAEFRSMRRQDIRMLDWDIFLDKFLHDMELPILHGPGKVSHDEATRFAQMQYDTFSDNCRIEMETQAEDRYWEDLSKSAENLEKERKKKPSKKSGKRPKDGENGNSAR